MCTTGEPAALSGGVPARINAATGGGWGLAVGSWQLAIGCWGLAFSGWRLAGARLRTKSRGVETKVFRPAVLLAETGEGTGTARGGIRRLAAGTPLRASQRKSTSMLR